MSLLAVPTQVEEGRSLRLRLVREAIEPSFLKLMQWDPVVGRLIFPKDHVQLGGVACRVEGCRKTSFKFAMAHGLCDTCDYHWQAAGVPVEEFLATARRTWRYVGKDACCVRDCPRPCKSAKEPFCYAHLHQQRVSGLSIQDFVRRPGVVALPSFGICQVLACDREKDYERTPYCMAHRNRLSVETRSGRVADEETWRRTTSPVTITGEINLRGLPELLVTEIIFGLQERTRSGAKTKDHSLRPLCDTARRQQVGSITEIDLAGLTRLQCQLVATFTTSIDRLGATPESERLKDVWDLVVFGMGGHLRFSDLSQPWLREAAKAWAVEELPQRRGKRAHTTIQSGIRSLAKFSESLRLQRDDHGMDPRRLGRADIVAFLHRQAFLQQEGALSADGRYKRITKVRQVLRRMRSLGLTGPGQPLDGLPGDVVLREEDIPDEAEDSEAGKDLPQEVMRQLCSQLDALDAIAPPHIRIAVELIIDTGRRPQEVSYLRWDCLDADEDGQPVLVYDNYKSHRLRRRLPIAAATAALITRQQETVRRRFPNTPTKDLALLPTQMCNPHGIKTISEDLLAQWHRTWVTGLPNLYVNVVVETEGLRANQQVVFDKARVFLYAYRHSYAQRHADAGVAPDVLKELMDHRQLSTTQGYYRVGQQRRREAVERVTAMQFDRHGRRIWRQAQLVLDSEHARRAVGEVAVPYGLCTEPSNVAAGGHDCPVRFRCVGCGHFRTDVSYLPDLESYLADLLRSRERLAAFSADDWAKGEAMPSDEEITRVRRLISRVRADLDELTDEDRAQIQQAVQVVRRTRQVVSLGLPRVRQPLPDLRPERPTA
ncbi:tyrosine-type recombinase/integrase [Streptomyces collinus]|uniref:tyrosine-type recombinase/integrase n=1 Tax=Streptomyces collinus TaxID=42684 RepID=UPI00343A87F4